MTAPKFVMTRQFAAPPELVWRTWTEQKFVERWYGPGLETEIHQFEPKPGGLWLNEMKMGEGSVFQRMEFTEVQEPSKLVLLMSNADGNWNIVPSPMMPNWPRILLTTVTFDAKDGGTELTLEWEPFDATEAEESTFAEAISGLDRGWGAGMDIIADIVAELQA